MYIFYNYINYIIEKINYLIKYLLLNIVRGLLQGLLAIGKSQDSS